MDASQSMSIPAVVMDEPRPASRRGTLLVVLGALLAGAASAAAVIAGLHYYDQHRREAQELVADPPVAPPPVREAQPEATPEPAVPPPVVTPPVQEPTAPEATRPEATRPAARSEAAPEPARRRVRAEPERADPPPAEERSEDTAAAPGSHLPGFGDPSPAASPLERAQQALRSGQPQRCIEILDEAIRQGSGAALALRRRADCYEAAGQRQRAIEDYQRFCRLVPDHPSVGEVRPLLESWGRSCP